MLLGVKYDVVVMATKKNLTLLKSVVPFYYKNLSVKELYVVSNADNKEEIEKIDGVNFVDESTIYPGLNIHTVGSLIESICGEQRKPGWYLQQFLKYAWALKCEEKCYVVIDADTFPLNPITFEDENGNYFFTAKIEYNQPYFDTLDKLFRGGVKRKCDFSFIAENMIFDSQHVRDLIGLIESNTELQGNVFWEKIIFAVNPSSLSKSGFSEFETYGNYMLNFYPEQVKARKLRTLREAVYILGSNPSYEKLLWASKDYDIISIELPEYKRTLMTTLADMRFVRRHFRLKFIAETRVLLRSAYRKIIRKKDFKFE